MKILAMKSRITTHLLAFSLFIQPALAQSDPAPLIEPVPPTPEAEAPAPTPAPAPAEAPPAVPEASVEPVSPPAVNVAPSAEGDDMTKSDEGFILKDASLNDIFQYLAKDAGKQYFHNAQIAGPEYLVTGHLNDGNPYQQMEDLAFMFGLSLHTKGNTIYALTQAQLAQLPSSEFHYQLRYLRPTDMEQIKELIKPMLSPGTGIVNFEPKTNTIIIIDSAHRIEQARDLLHGIDKVKGQIVVETKILRVNSTAGKRTGVDWSGSLGVNGTNLSAIRGLNSMFGLDDIFSETGTLLSGGSPLLTTAGSSNLVLSPLQMNGVLRALAEGGLASQVSNPTLITEDNEQATISIIDRVPIITTTSTQSTNGGNPTVTEEVRYKIDQADPSIDMNPEKHREIGISISVTPTLLPDGTIRMKMRPRSAQIVESIVSAQTGNRYPRVTESMVESLARVPDGHSLVVGGFYGAADEDNDNKVPLLGDIPVLNFFFKSDETTKERASLVFVVTPKSYDPTSISGTRFASNHVRSVSAIEKDAMWVDPENPGPAHEANLKRTLRGMQPVEAPYYPRAESNRPRISRSRR